MGIGGRVDMLSNVLLTHVYILLGAGVGGWVCTDVLVGGRVGGL